MHFAAVATSIKHLFNTDKTYFGAVHQYYVMQSVTKNNMEDLAQFPKNLDIMRFGTGGLKY